MTWNFSGLSLNRVTVKGQDGDAVVSNGDKDVTVEVSGAGMMAGISLVFVRTVGLPAEIIPVNNVVRDEGDANRKLEGKISPVLKNCGQYALVAWNPPPGDNEEGVPPHLNDAYVLEDALEVEPLTEIPTADASASA